MTRLGGEVFSENTDTEPARLEQVVTFATVAQLKLASLTPGQAAETQGYYDGWAALATPQGAAKYIIATLQDVRDTKSNPSFVPDEKIDLTLANGFIAMFQSDGGIHVKQAGGVGDDSTNDGVSLATCDAWLVDNGIGELNISDGIYQISSVFTLSAGNSLIGTSRSNSFIKQINDAADGIKVSGGCTLRNIRIEAPITGVNTGTIGLDVSGSADVIVEQVRVLYFGRCVQSTGLTWRQSYIHVRCEQPRLYGFYFNEPNVHLEIYLNQCYVVNTGLLGSSVKEAYHIEGSLGTKMTLCTSDGGATVGETTLGMNIISSQVVCDMSHWEGYKIRTGHIGGAEYDSIIRIAGSTVSMNGIRFHNCEASVPADDVLIYGENQSSITLNGVKPNTNTFNSFSSQHFGIGDDFGDNLMTIEGGNRDLVLGAQRGTGVGEAQYTRKGKIVKEIVTGASTVIDVNLVDTIILTGNSGDISGFSGAHSDGQEVRIMAREAGVELTHSAAFRLIGKVNRTVAINDTYNFEYFHEAGFFVEMSRNLT